MNNTLLLAVVAAVVIWWWSRKEGYDWSPMGACYGQVDCKSGYTHKYYPLRNGTCHGGILTGIYNRNRPQCVRCVRSPQRDGVAVLPPMQNLMKPW